MREEKKGEEKGKEEEGKRRQKRALREGMDA